MDYGDMVRGAKEEQRGKEGGGVVLSFRRAGEAGTWRGDGWRQKLGGFWSCGRLSFRVYTKHVQECKNDVCQHGWQGD